MLEHRRMSEPSTLLYRPADVRHLHFHAQSYDDHEPISPLQPNFSGTLLADPAAQYSDDYYYGPSPPGTGTSTSSAPTISAEKTYSFVALPGNAIKKRPRRRYDEIERLYQCAWPECTKSYGTLNHLNAHVTMQKHGPKRSPAEFKELRKQWRKAKKDSEATAEVMRRQSYESFDDHGPYDHRGLLHFRPSDHHQTTELHYPDDLLPGRQRDFQPSWQGGSFVRQQQSQYHHLHHSQLPQLAIQNSASRLSQTSTLLTPLPGYQHSMVALPDAPFQVDSYGMYERPIDAYR